MTAVLAGPMRLELWTSLSMVHGTWYVSSFVPILGASCLCVSWRCQAFRGFSV